MPTLPELSARVDELQIALDAEQVEIQNAINNLQETITLLEAQVVAGGTEAERQAVLDKLNGIVADLEATIP